MKTTDDTPPTGCPTVIFLSLTWVALGFGLALSIPWLGLLSPSLLLAINVLALSLTLGFIGTCLFHAVRVVRYTGHTLDALPLTLVQALLFSLLFVQISCHLGARHYEWEADPSGWHWVGFVLLHAARAGDILDGLHAYGLNFQPIRHAGWVTATTLVVYRGILSLFLIRLILEWVGSLRQRLAAPALPDLMRLVENQDELAWVRVATIQALGSIDPRSTETLSGVLIARLKDPNGQVREAAARSLGLLGPGAASAVPALRECLSDPAPATRRAAIQAVGRMGPAGAPAVPDLIQQLSHGRYQEQAIEALGLIGPAAAAALPDLLKLTTNIGSSRIRRAATEAVGRIGPGSENVDHLPALVARLSDLDSSIRKVAAEGLGRLGPKATVAVPPLLRLSDTNPAVQQAVTEALTAIDPNWRKLPRPEKTPQ